MCHISKMLSCASAKQSATTDLQRMPESLENLYDVVDSVPMSVKLWTLLQGLILSYIN